jgi:hypothetical protein
MSLNRCSAHLREGRMVSAGKTAQPVGTPTTSVVPVVNQPWTVEMLAQYSRADEAPDAVNQ